MVKADATKLKNSATTIDGLKDDLKLDDVNKINVKPGNFQAANDLKVAVNARKGEVVTFVKDITKELGDIAKKLRKNAGKVTETEAENLWKAKDVDIPDSGYDSDT